LIKFIHDYAESHFNLVLISLLGESKIKDAIQMTKYNPSTYKYIYDYSALEDASIEIETSIIYTPTTRLPRAIRFNITGNAYGMSINYLEATIRIEGLENVINQILIKLLNYPQFMNNLDQIQRMITQTV
jgi:hypothetical protein